MGLSTRLPRPEWPEEIVLRVFNELESEVQHDTIIRELWLKSDHIRQVNVKQSACVQSMAMMSIIGYVLGLGDRHLGNILLMGSTGELAHIDYNVIFGRGETLPVPEVVPFRFTKILRTVCNQLSGKGVGEFEFACRSMLSTLTSNRLNILNCLSTFTVDPIADWILSTSVPNLRKINEKRLPLLLLSQRFKSNIYELKQLLAHLETILPSLLAFFKEDLELSNGQPQQSRHDYSTARRSSHDRYSVNSTSKLEQPCKLHLLHKNEYLGIISALTHLLQWHALYNLVSKTSAELTTRIEKLHSSCEYLFHLFKSILGHSSQSSTIITNTTYNAKDIQDAEMKLRECIREFPTELTSKLTEIDSQASGNPDTFVDQKRFKLNTDTHPADEKLDIFGIQALNSVAKNLFLEDYHSYKYESIHSISAQLIASKVHSLIAMAVDRSRLCRLYEGWAPWI
jgi:hypothetical protein